MMKKMLLTLVCAAAAVLPVCAQQPDTVRKAAIVEKHLDKNGHVYAYEDTGAQLEDLKNLFTIFAEPITQRVPECKPYLTLFQEAWTQGGLGKMQASGCSMVQEGDLYRSKSFALLPRASRSGSTALQKNAENGLPMQDIAPADSMVALAAMFDGKVIWEQIAAGIIQYGPPHVKMEFADFQTQFKQMTALELSQTVSSIESMGFFLTSGDEMPMFPGIGSVTVVIGVKDNSLFEAVKRIAAANDPSLLVNGELIFPAGPVKITVFQHGGYLVATTAPDNMKALCKGGRIMRLAGTPEFKKISRNMPQNGFAWGYSAPETGTVLLPLLLKFSEAEVPGLKNYLPAISSYISYMGLDKPVYVINTENADGYLTVSQCRSRVLAGILAGSLVDCFSSLTPLMLFPAIAEEEAKNWDASVDDDDEFDDDEF